MIFDRVLYKGRRSIQPPEKISKVEFDLEPKKKKSLGMGEFSLYKSHKKEEDFDLEQIDAEYQ